MQLPTTAHECVQDLQPTAFEPHLVPPTLPIPHFHLQLPSTTVSRTCSSQPSALASTAYPFPLPNPPSPTAAAFNDSVQDLQALEAKFQEAYKAPEIDLHAGASAGLV